MVNRLVDPKLGVTFKVLACRPLTRPEMVNAVSAYLSKNPVPKRGQTAKILTIYGC